MIATSPRVTSAAPSLIGRRAELHELLTAFRSREPRLIFGPRGAGKTALLAVAIARLPPAQRSRVLAPPPCATPAEFVAELLAQLVNARDHIACAHASTARRASARTNAATLIESLSASPYWIVVDPFTPASRPLARLLKHVLTRARTPIYAATRTLSASDLGHAAGLYRCHELRIELGPLAPSSARELVARETASIPLAVNELADLRSSVLRFGARLPGPMLEMCRLANDPAYRSYARMKSALLQIDARIAAHHAATASPPAAQRQARISGART
jgi:hypothetical protein